METLFLIFIGIIAGSIGSLVGVGGGFIIIPTLIILFPFLLPSQIAAISLICVFINSLFGFLSTYKLKRLDYKTGFILSIFTVPGSILGIIFSPYIPIKPFSIILGIIFILAAIILFKNTYKDNFDKISVQKNYSYKVSLTDYEGTNFSYSFDIKKASLISILIGFLSTVFGIGGGIFYIPIFVSLLLIPVKIATSTSQFILMLSSSIGSFLYLYNGVLSELPSNFFFIPLGILIGVMITSLFFKKIHSTIVIRIFSFILILTSLRIIYSAIIK